MKIGRIATLGLAACMVAGASAQITKQGAGYLFRIKYVKGQSMKYVMNAKGAQGAQTFSMNTPISMKVASVSGSTGTIDYSVGPMKMMLNGKPMNMGGQQANKMTLQIDNRGKVVGGAGQNPGGSISLPAGPVKIGSTWSDTATTTAGAAGAMKVQATYKFIGIQSVGGKQAAKVSVSMKGTGNANVTGTGTILLNMADGSLIRNDNTMYITMGQTKMPMTMSIVRQ